VADLRFYKRAIGVSTVDGLCEILCASLMKTNRAPEFWVDWSKVNRRSDAYSRQLALLSTLRGSEAPRSDLAKLLKDYPEVAQAFPRLLAEQKDRLSVLVEVSSPFESVDLDFTKSELDDADIEALVAFADQSGLLTLLTGLSHTQDYLLGVEVGLDSNARKNRSGVVLEKLVEAILDSLIKEHSELRLLKQDSFRTAAERFGVRCPPLMENTRFDFAVLCGKVPTNIEVNFYGGSGSKPSEIVNAYSDRARTLGEYGWRLVWITDGPGWLKMRHPLLKGVSDIEYVLNLQMVRDGLLKAVLLGP
jgi:type II restriction enzyme